MIQRGMRRPRKKFYISKRALRPGNVIFTIVNTLIMLCVIVVMLYPFWNTIAVSFNDAQDTLRGGIKLFPRVFSLYSYQSVFKNKLMVIAAINSVLRTLISTVPSAISATSDSNSRFTRSGWVRLTRILGPFVVFLTSRM